MLINVESGTISKAKQGDQTVHIFGQWPIDDLEQFLITEIADQRYR
jgi:hypothetical protein